MAMSVKTICRLVDYDMDTGAVTWKGTGKPAFSSPSGHGYLMGKAPTDLGGQTVYAHRVAFAVIFGRWPRQIDHINGVRSDNRIENLREVDQSENQKNAKRYRSNNSGQTGVSWDSVNRTWRAVISVGGRQVHIGRYTRKTDAIRARKAAEKRFGFHKNHGRN